MPQLKGPVPQVQAKEGPMPQLVKKRRSGWALLAVSALIASLFAVGAAPAGAAEIKAGEDNKAEPNAEATFSACVGEARDAHGFTDLGSLEATVPNINCLAYYGITVGRTADTFDPNSNVTRREMALFLYRAASKAGVDLMGGDMSADYGDIAELGESWQNAITALARNGILSGSGGNFRPKDDITRAEMAVALVALAKHVAPGKFIQSGANKGALDIDADELDHFADARASEPRFVDTAISYAYELGITSGVGDGTMFNPSGTVPRRDMATFIMKTLAHSNLRPAGMSVQSDRGTITVSMRDADFMPDANEIVDAFYVSNDKVDRAFNADGECRSIVTAVDGSDECEIDSIDPATDADGNAQLEPLTSKDVGKGVTVWVWTGNIGDEVDEDTDTLEFAQGPVVTPNAATMTAVSPSQLKTPRARFGAAVEFTAQLQYTNPNGVATSTASGANPADGGAQYKLVRHVYSGKPVASMVRMGANGLEWGNPTGTDGAFEAASDQAAAGPQDGDQAGGLVSRSVAETLKTNATGAATFSLTTTDPDTSAESDDDYRTVVYVLTADTDKNAPMGDHAGFVIFSEAGSEVTVVKVTAIMGYAEAPSAGRSTGNGVVVTVLDQYHRPMRGQGITLTSDDNTDDDNDGEVESDEIDSVLPGTRHTASTGSVRISYSHRSSEADVETITAWWESTRNLASDHADYTAVAARPAECPATGGGSYRGAETTADGVTTADVTTYKCGDTSVYWVDRVDDDTSGDSDPNTDTAAAKPIEAGSVDDNEIVVDSDGDSASDPNPVVPWLIRYDDNDILQVTRTVDGTVMTDYVDLDGFEETLALILDPDNEDANTNTGTLAWSSYDHDDEDDRSLFTLTVVPPA